MFAERRESSQPAAGDANPVGKRAQTSSFGSPHCLPATGRTARLFRASGKRLAGAAAVIARGQFASA